MKKIIVYGNEIIDQVIEINGFLKENHSHEILRSFSRIGGTGNFIRSLLKDFCIEKVVVKSNALIITNVCNGSRTSIVDWKDSHLMKTPINETNWLHIMYLDKLCSLDEDMMIHFRQKSKMISADLCLSKQTEQNLKRFYRIFPYIDFLIISDIEAKGIKSIIQRSRNFIVHSPNGICYNNNYERNIYYRDKVKNTLGAGDHFAAIFVSYKILEKETNMAIQISNLSSSKFVLNSI